MNFMLSLYAFSEAEKVQCDTVKTEKVHCLTLHKTFRSGRGKVKPLPEHT